MEGERDGCESKNTMERPSFQSVLSVNSSNIPPGLSLGGDQFIDDKKKKVAFRTYPAIPYFKGDLGQVGSLIGENNNKLSF